MLSGGFTGWQKRGFASEIMNIYCPVGFIL
jgi:hypothetical protein